MTTAEQETRTVLALDPALKRTGFAVARDGRLLDYGCLVTDEKAGEGERLRQIWKGLWELFRVYDVDEIALETCFLGRNARTLQTLSEVRGVVLLVGAMAGIPVFQYPPAVVKQVVTGKGNSTKEVVAEAVRKLWKGSGLPERKASGSLDVTDAMAVLYTHLRSRGADQPDWHRTTEGEDSICQVQSAV